MGGGLRLYPFQHRICADGLFFQRRHTVFFCIIVIKQIIAIPFHETAPFPMAAKRICCTAGDSSYAYPRAISSCWSFFLARLIRIFQTKRLGDLPDVLITVVVPNQNLPVFFRQRVQYIPEQLAQDLPVDGIFQILAAADLYHVLQIHVLVISTDAVFRPVSGDRRQICGELSGFQLVGVFPHCQKNIRSEFLHI